MKVVRKNQTKEFRNSEVCMATEYPLGDKDINGAIVKLNGRYPDKNKVVNLKCKELAYIIRGSGRLIVGNTETKLSEGDLVLLEAGEPYYWEGNMEMFVPCTPAWYPEQHKEVE
jgi:mannose-6-phosphate isomerase-like protein (cupin superfamily)